MFVRVKSSNPVDPQHEFDVSLDEFLANESTYLLLDPEPVRECRPPVYVFSPPVPVKKSKKK